MAMMQDVTVRIETAPLLAVTNHYIKTLREREISLTSTVVECRGCGFRSVKSLLKACKCQKCGGYL